LTSRLHPLAILRIGGGMCADHGTAIVGILREMTCLATGKPFQAKRLGAHAHSLAAVWMEDRWVLLDGTPNSWKAFFRRDNCALAGIDEVGRDPALTHHNGSTIMKYLNAPFRLTDPVETMWPCPVKSTEATDQPGLLPPLRRVTTRNGAPSDFTLMTEDGSGHFNLMAAGALAKIGGWIEEKTHGEEERLRAVLEFVESPAVFQRSTVMGYLACRLTPLSILRLGGGNERDRVAVAVGLLNTTQDSDDQTRRARILSDGDGVFPGIFLHGRWQVLTSNGLFPAAATFTHSSPERLTWPLGGAQA
ncbi:MAG: hypothetical protein ACYTGH_18525, partial [Planctomycetota bacterium]